MFNRKLNIMKHKFSALLKVSLVFFFLNNLYAEDFTVKSPDGKLSVNFWLNEKGEAFYKISHSGNTVLYESKLGLLSSDGDFSKNLKLDSVSNEIRVYDKYTLMHGKRLNCEYTANKRVFYCKNKDSRPLEIIFQVSNDGVAFRYFLPEKSAKKITIYKEITSFHFDNSTKGFLQPCPDARTGWSYSQPSYEEYYQINIPVGTPSPFQAGWVMPALFNSGNYWISITETAVDTNYCGSRLSQFSPEGEYTIQFPQPQECRAGEPYLPESTLPWFTPWRVIVLTENLADLVESTLGTDLANPAQYDVSSWLKPGLSSWSWVILKDNATVYEVQKSFIDFAAQMKWRYCLIDALWDTQIGYDKLKELTDYANTKNVKILIWYNSAGDWNTTTITPRDKLLTSELRNAEFSRLKEMGIAGIKVDFFGGDGQSMMKYYIDILKDAAKYKLAVYFHGATYPRGWHRTYPNLVSMEAIRGEEYVTFSQYFADNQPWHCTVIPFTRNLFDPMDFTPVNFSGIPHIQRRSTGGFELALSVVFTSGIQHIAETPEGMAKQVDFIKEYMSTLPETWDDIKFIDGYPGKYVVIARKKGNTWYIAGINGEKNERIIEINPAFISKKVRGFMITDADDGKSFIKQNVDFSKPIKIKMLPYGGFIIKTL
jgi:hypothetical protein